MDAFAKDGADTDKDGRVSLLEAYTYAQAEVKRFYEVDGRLATEHSQIADNDQLARRFFSPVAVRRERRTIRSSRRCMPIASRWTRGSRS